MGALDLAEQFWLYAVQLKPFYWDAIDQLIALFNSQDRRLKSVSLIRGVLDSSEVPTKVQNTPRDWAKYLSLYHSLGDIYCSQSQYYDAALTFSVLAAMALSVNPVDSAHLGLSAAVSSNKQPTSRSDLFLPTLIAQIRKAITELNATSQDNQSQTLGSAFFSITPTNALLCKYKLLPPNGKFPIRANSREWLRYIHDSSLNHYQNNTTIPAANSTLEIVVSNALLNLAKIFQDGISSGIPARILYIDGVVPTHTDILSLYMFSLSLNPSPSTANNIGILLASLSPDPSYAHNQKATIAPVQPVQPNATSNPRELAIQYYNFGLMLDSTNPHIYTNYGSLLREQGKPKEAIVMYQKAVEYDPNFNIALTNLASALRDQGQIDQTIHFYRRAVECSPDFIEAISGLANAQASVCDWTGRGGCGWEPVSVDANGALVRGHLEGWVSKVVSIADQQIADAKLWGIGVIDSELKRSTSSPNLMDDIESAIGGFNEAQRGHWETIWASWRGRKDEGAKIVQLIELVMRMCQRRWYMDRIKGLEGPASSYCRPKIPSGLPIPLATTILPFHAFTLPFNAAQILQISQRSSIRISMSALLQSWLPTHVFPPPAPPVPIDDKDGAGRLVVGYISSDFLDHPLSHLMQSVFGFHDRTRFHAICYATTASDGSEYRAKIERESHEFKDVSGWSNKRVVNEIMADGVHILVNLNGFTRGSRNDIFAVRPCPIQISLVGFAGSLGGGWCDYLLGDKHSIGERVDNETWVYKENIMYMPRSFFVCDHRQSAPDSRAQRELRAAKKPSKYSNFLELQADIEKNVAKNEKKQFILDEILSIPGELTWDIETQLRAEVRQVLFPQLPSNAFLMANLNQLYKIDPTTFRIWLNILERLPNAYLWLLQFPKSGETNLKATALRWTNQNHQLVDRIIFTPVADKSRHILRARACDLFLDTPECNAHTTAADVAWTGTPIVTYKRHRHKMCSRIAASIITAALPDTALGREMASELVPETLQGYEDQAVYFGSSDNESDGSATTGGRARLEQIRRAIFEGREVGDGFFDTRKWVRDVEEMYRKAWNAWVKGKCEDLRIET